MTEESSCPTCSDTSCSAKSPKPGEEDPEFLERQAITSRMCKIKHKLVVLSGKGGVGKSTAAVNLATSLAMAGKKVGLLDIDIHGPSIPKLLHIENAPVTGSDTTIDPVEVFDNLWVMSIGLLLHGKDEAVIWRGPMKYNAIKQFLKDVTWGELDYLLVDSPPGTGDEPLSVVQLLDNPDGAIIVTTPQELALQDVRRSIMFCRQLNLPIFGVIENMSGFICPHCHERTDIFGSGGGEAMASDMKVPFLGAIPIEPDVVSASDEGTPVVQSHPHSETALAFKRIVRKMLEPELQEAAERPIEKKEKGESMKIAIPLAQGALSLHFGHCEQFAIFDVDAENKKILGKQLLTPPPHEPGSLPRWLHEKQADVIITGGMGAMAQSLFAQNGIKVITGATAQPPDQVVQDFLNDSLQTGANVCDH
ncbi:MAG TPA: iron-sulfur cluster carrier protein MrpORP [Myxococcota bacterium]|nr:iron-sulfur cluster carrier protein MrpORP [Myxococcota bacterium]